MVDRLPGFQMYDPYVTHEMTIRDLLTHRSGLGLGAGDLLFFPPSSYTRDDIIAKLRYIKPESSFRSKYAYDNLLYMVAGQIIPAVTGKQWQDFIKERIFAAVGMTDSNTSVADFRPGGNFATPHSEVEGKLQPIPAAQIDNVAPAGAINSSVSDMAKWMIVQLGGGQLPGGDRRSVQRKSRTGNVVRADDSPVGRTSARAGRLANEFRRLWIGLGSARLSRTQVVSHTGGLPGYVSQVSMIPDTKLGVVLLTNQEATGILASIVDRILDAYLADQQTDWTKIFHDLVEQQRAQCRRSREEAQRRPKRCFQAVARTSKNTPATTRMPGMAISAISMETNGLVMRFSHSPALTGDLEHWQYDTFVARWRDRSLAADAFVTFALNPDGSINQVKMVPVSPLTDFSYDFQDLLITPKK